MPQNADLSYGSLRLRAKRLQEVVPGSQIVSRLVARRGRVPFVPQKVVTEETLEVLQKCRGRFVLDICEVFLDPSQQEPYDKAMSLAAVVTCASKELWLWASERTEHALYLPDMIEVSLTRIRQRTKGSLPLVFWYGFRENYLHLREYFDVVRLSGVGNMLVMTDREPNELRWDWEHFIKLLSVCDIGLAPVKLEGVFHSHVRFKSGHKILNYLAAGVPVLCGPLPEYRVILGDCYEALAADTAGEVVERLNDVSKLRLLSPRLRKLSRDYEPKAMGRRWAKELQPWRI